MAKKKFENKALLIYRENYRIFEALSDEERGKVVLKLMELAFGDLKTPVNIENLDKDGKMVYWALESKVLNDAGKYIDTCKKYSRNAKSKKGETETAESEDESDEQGEEKRTAQRTTKRTVIRSTKSMTNVEILEEALAEKNKEVDDGSIIYDGLLVGDGLIVDDELKEAMKKWVEYLDEMGKHFQSRQIAKAMIIEFATYAKQNKSSTIGILVDICISRSYKSVVWEKIGEAMEMRKRKERHNSAILTD